MNRNNILLTSAAVTFAFGCGSESAESIAPWQADTTTVIGPTQEADTQSTPQDEGCIYIADDTTETCVQPQAECEAGGAADVIVDQNGKVVDTVCYPATSDVVEVAEVIDGTVPQNANNTAIVFGDQTLDDDLNVDANNVVLYGDDPATSVLEGDLTLDGNNATVRGVTITGDVTVTKNDASFVYCRIEGNVLVLGNNVVLSGCEIFGDVTVEGNNAEFFGNRIAGDSDLSGKNLKCDGNLVFDDINEDGVISDDELGQEFSCK